MIRYFKMDLNKTIILLIVIATVACKSSLTHNHNPIIDTVLIPSITYMEYDSIIHKSYFEHGIPYQITPTDSTQIESLLNECIASYNLFAESYYQEVKAKHPNDSLNKENFILILSRYKRQYMAVLNTKGEKEVWVNCFCRHWDWKLNFKKTAVRVADGGNCFFNFRTNLTQNTYNYLMVNDSP